MTTYNPLDIDRAAVAFVKLSDARALEYACYRIDLHPEHKKPELRKAEFLHIVHFLCIDPGAPEDCSYPHVACFYPPPSRRFLTLVPWEQVYRKQLKLVKSQILAWLDTLKLGHIYLLASTNEKQVACLYKSLKTSSTIRAKAEVLKVSL